jgi:type IV secretory pathway VirJ component
MIAKRWLPIILAALCATQAASAAQPSAPSPQPSTPNTPSTEPLDYGLFGTLHLRRPPNAITHTVMLVSDRDGWSARQDALAVALAGEGAFVIGIDLPVYLKRMAAIDDHCSFPAAHFEEVAHWVERHENLASYSYPLVVGDGSGATFAYAMTAQAPAGTFEGLLTLGWDAGLRFAKPFCPGDAGGMTIATEKGRFRVAPLPKFPLPWVAQPFAPGARAGEFGGHLMQIVRMLGALLPLPTPDDAGAAFARTYAAWRLRDAAATTALPDDVADLPLTDIAATANSGDSHRIAVIITGDGGWAGLDRGIADALTAHGVHVIGFSTLKFFWQKQTPDATAQALSRVIAHFGKDDPAATFVLIGYSFGASLVPVVINRLPDLLRRRVQGGVMISPDDEAVFEIHVGDWFGSTHHDEAIPIGPEIAASKVALVCVHGVDEDDSFCLKPQPAQVRVVALPGGHHYDGDYDKLGALILQNLPGASPVPPAK